MSTTNQTSQNIAKQLKEVHPALQEDCLKDAAALIGIADFKAGEKEWIRVSEACAYAGGISKPLLYNWMNDGLIRNVSLRKRGQIKGLRLVHFASLKAFLESMATGGC